MKEAGSKEEGSQAKDRNINADTTPPKKTDCSKAKPKTYGKI